MRDEMLRVLPTVLTAGSACAPLRAPREAAPASAATRSQTYHALKDETLLRHAARASRGRPPRCLHPRAAGEEAAEHGGGMG